ncbi:DUF2583 family protein [Proteus mirabilis]
MKYKHAFAVGNLLMAIGMVLMLCSVVLVIIFLAIFFH